MSTLNLTKAWINLLPNGDAVSAQSDPRRALQYDINGQVRTYGAGRQRSVSTEGERGTFSFMLVDVSAATVETLRGWKGRDVLYRDHRGQRFFGVYWSISPIEQRQASLWNVAITMRTLTVAEGV